MNHNIGYLSLFLGNLRFPKNKDPRLAQQALRAISAKNEKEFFVLSGSVNAKHLLISRNKEKLKISSSNHSI